MNGKQVDEADKGWTAGIIDGEGSIGIYLCPGATRKGFQLAIEVSNSDTRMISRLKELWGGWTKPRTKQKSFHKQQWRWGLSSREAMEFLEIIFPYLISKKEQALLAIEFQKRKKCNYGARRLPRNEVEVRENIAKKMKELKRQGG